ncbi:hypothetical protein SDC9_116634 [bioreactor metagenome]|uniref:Uncharacterized protein n=1 Tax=bioreactor metagenome TaxID=1076179 RepID=A0A645BW05_9ZZZZ
MAPLNEKVKVIQSIIHLTQRVSERRLKADSERSHGPFCGIPVYLNLLDLYLSIAKQTGQRLILQK